MQEKQEHVTRTFSLTKLESNSSEPSSRLSPSHPALKSQLSLLYLELNSVLYQSLSPRK